MEILTALDIRTIIVLIILGNLAAIVMLAAYASGSISQRVYWQFLAGKLFQAAAWVLLGERGSIPDLYSAYVGNSVLFIGFALETLAIITTILPGRRWGRTFAIITGVCVLAFWVLASGPNLWVLFASLATFALYAPTAFFLLRTARGSRLRLIMGVLYSLFSLMMFLRAVYAAANQNFVLLTSNFIQSMAFLVLYLLLLLGCIGFLLLLRERTDIELMEAYRSLDLLSHRDGLTGLFNRRAFDSALEHSIRECRRRAEPLTLVMIDIDYFKNYNDYYGHAEGDACIKAVSREIERMCRRPNDLAARYGGDEFGVILPNTEGSSALKLAEEIRQSVYDLAVPHLASEAAGRVTVSLGVFSAIPGAEGHNEAWYIAGADRQLYLAKKNGRNRSSQNFPLDQNG